MDILTTLFQFFKVLGLPKTIATFQILTLNIWGLPDSGLVRLSQYRTERVQVLCEVLKQEAKKENGIDVVLLQEAWMHRDRLYLSKCGYSAFSVDWATEDLDSGLMILTRHPASDQKRVTYRSQGDWRRVTKDGEALVRKSLQLLKVKHPVMGDVWVGNTHTASVSLEHGRDMNLERRRRQLTEMVDAAERVAQDQPLLLGGDMNSGPGYALWDEVSQTVFKDFVQAPNAGETANCTYCPPNTFVKESEGKLDHVLLRSNDNSSTSRFRTVSEGIVTAKELYSVRQKELNLSDHFGWLVRVQ